jgi:hypothetical protein
MKLKHRGQREFIGESPGRPVLHLVKDLTSESGGNP